MKSLTVDQIMALNPCDAYPESRVRDLWAGRDALSLIEILRLDIPPNDRIWVLTRKGVCDRDLLMLWIDRVVERAVRKFCLTCGIPAVETWARGWLEATDRSYKTAKAARAAARAQYQQRLMPALVEQED